MGSLYSTHSTAAVATAVDGPRAGEALPEGRAGLPFALFPRPRDLSLAPQPVRFK